MNKIEKKTSEKPESQGQKNKPKPVINEAKSNGGNMTLNSFWRKKVGWWFRKVIEIDVKSEWITYKFILDMNTKFRHNDYSTNIIISSKIGSYTPYKGYKMAQANLSYKKI